MDWSKAVTIAVVTAVVPLVLKVISTSRGAPPPGEVRYSLGIRLVTLAMALVPPVGVALAVTFQERPLRPGEPGAVAFLILLFLGLGGPLAIEAVGVRHTFDEERLNRRSPWTGRRPVRWEDVTLLKWSPSWRWLVIRDTHGGVVRLSPLCGGLQALGRTALERLPPAVLQASPTSAAVLELMRRGHVAGLVMSQVTPEMQVLDLPPEP